MGFPCSARKTEWVRLFLSTGSSFDRDEIARRFHPSYFTFWLEREFQVVSLLCVYGSYGSSLTLAMPFTPSASPPRPGSFGFSSRSLLRISRGSIVLRASHRDVTITARLSRGPLAIQRVSSRWLFRDSLSSDITSHARLHKFLWNLLMLRRKRRVAVAGDRCVSIQQSVISR